MSVRDQPVLWLTGRKTIGGSLVAGGGNVLLKTPRHKLDGPEHQVADDTTTLDATTDQHGLMPKLPGDATRYLDGSGEYSIPTGSGGLVPTYIGPTETFTVPANRQALFSIPIVVDGLLVVDGYLVQVD